MKTIYKLQFYNEHGKDGVASYYENKNDVSKLINMNGLVDIDSYLTIKTYQKGKKRLSVESIELL